MLNPLVWLVAVGVTAWLYRHGQKRLAAVTLLGSIGIVAAYIGILFFGPQTTAVTPVVLYQGAETLYTCTGPWDGKTISTRTSNWNVSLAMAGNGPRAAAAWTCEVAR